MKITLIAVVLVLAGCQSQAIPSTATATSTSTEIPATATLTATNTPEPTATATELVLPDNAVRIVGGGYVYVENDKVMQVGKDGVTKEIKDISTDVVFQTMEDAGNIFEALNAEAINKFGRLDFFPNGPYAPLYAGMVDSSRLKPLDSTGSGLSQILDIVAIPRYFARINSPVKSSHFQDLTVAFTQVNGYPGLVPVPVGAYDTNGFFVSKINGVRNYKPSEYLGEVPGAKRTLPPTFAAQFTWLEVQNLLKDNIMVFMTPFSVPSSEAENLKYYSAPDDALDPEMELFRDALILNQAQTVGALGYDFTTTHEILYPNAGVLLDQVDGLSNDSFYVVSTPGTLALIHTDQ